jgi:hypothetical protein
MSRTEREVAHSVAEELRNQARQASWASNPAGWARDVLGVHMWSKQEEISHSVVSHKRTVVASCHGTGKSMIASVLACWWISTRPLGEAIVVSTAPTYAQVNKILWEEIRKHHATARLRGTPMIGYVTLGDEWKTTDGQQLAFGRKPAHGDRHGFQGIHRKYVLAIGDEACFTDSMFNAPSMVMTRRGWIPWNEVLNDDEFLTMDASTHRAYYTRAVRVVRKQYAGDIYQYSGTGTAFSVTPDHRMLYLTGRRRGKPGNWKMEEIGNISSLANKGFLRTIDWDAPEADWISDDYLSLLGWFGSEGSIMGGEYRSEIRIHQSRKANPVYWEEIRALCERMGLDARVNDEEFRILDKSLAQSLMKYGRMQVERRVPDFVRTLSRRQIGVYLEAYWKGDGYLRKTDRIIYTSSPGMADDLQELILKLGYPSVVRERGIKGRQTVIEGRTVTSKNEGYIVTWPLAGSQHSWPKDANLEVVPYDGMVYCATLPKDHLLFTRQGKYTMWSGNCGLPEEIWTGIEAITTGDSCRMLFIGNPDDRITEFGNAFLDPKSAKDWNRISVPADSTPNFTGEEVPPLLNEVLVSRAWAEERLRNWGKDDPRYISKVLAKFPEQSKSSLFPPALIAASMEDVPVQPVGPVVRLGVDVARFGTDLNVVVSHAGVTAKVEDTWGGTDTVSSAHKVLQIAENLRDRLKASWVEIRVDAVGLGAGVVDTLNARAVLLADPWFSVYEMHGSASPPVDVGGSVHGYGNARAYWFDQLRQQMRNGRVKIHGAEFDQQIADDLGMVFYEFRTGKLFIISKEQMRKDHGRSPDYADALAYATAPVAEGLPVGTTVSDPAHAVAEDLEDMIDLSEMSIAPF